MYIVDVFGAKLSFVSAKTKTDFARNLTIGGKHFRSDMLSDHYNFNSHNEKYLTRLYAS